MRAPSELEPGSRMLADEVLADGVAADGMPRSPGPEIPAFGALTGKPARAALADPELAPPPSFTIDVREPAPAPAGRSAAASRAERAREAASSPAATAEPTSELGSTEPA